MNILFLGDIVGASGCEAIKKYLLNKIKELKIDFVIANGENQSEERQIVLAQEALQHQDSSMEQNSGHFDISSELTEFQNDALEKIRSLDMTLVSEDKWVRRSDAFIRIHK